MITIVGNKIYVNGALLCAVNLELTAEPEKFMEWMYSMISEWFENIETGQSA